MGWTVLYIAFGVVAVWLLAEVLLQYKARLRWRLLAFGGFLCVVVGAVMPSVLVIALGIAAFATGQTFVTLSYRRGFSTGWALGGSPGSSRRRRGGPPRDAEPSLEVSDLQTYAPEPAPEPVDDYGYAAYHQSDQPAPDAADNSPYGEDGYGTYGDRSDDTQVYASPFAESQPYANAGYGGTESQPYAHAEYGNTEYGNTAYGDTAYGGAASQPYGHPAAETQAYPYTDASQQRYAAYQDPYGGYGYDPASAGYDSASAGYDQQGTATDSPHSSYDYAGYGGDYGYQQPQGHDQTPRTPYYPDVPETPPGGVWVPQQREAVPPPLPPEQPPAPPSPHGYDDDQQYPHGYYGTDQRTGY